MSRRFSSESGQLLVPMVGVLLVFGVFSAGYLRWCRALYWKTRMETAADAAALSAARAQAQMLNRISTGNLVINNYVQKGHIPFTKWEGGAVSLDKYPEFVRKSMELKRTFQRFKPFAIGIGQGVAKANGAEGVSLFLPTDMNSLLHGVDLPVLIYMKAPPYVAGAALVNDAYYVRDWSPGHRKAQPPHRTTWLVRGHGFKAYSTARVWLDVPTSDILHNGGFPRPNEGWIGALLVQNFYPQFTARLSARIGSTSRLLQGLLGSSNEG